MGWLKDISNVRVTFGKQTAQPTTESTEYNSDAYAYDYGLEHSSLAEHNYGNIWSVTTAFDGEKEPGEMGPPKKILIDNQSLRLRSWEAYLKSDITQMIVGRHISWVVSSGLKLQLEPAKLMLKNMGVVIPDSKEFIRMIEESFGVYTKSKASSWSNRSNLHLEVAEILKNAIVGGDVLVQFHVKAGDPKVQITDGLHVKTPFLGTAFHTAANDRGNQIIDGIEINPKTKEHVAFFVQNKDLTFTRIPAKGARTGRTSAFLYCGFKYRIDDNRGIPLLAAVLQTLRMLDRYKEATVGSAEERAKIAYSIEHGKNSTGENPMAAIVQKATGQSVSASSSESQTIGKKLAKFIVNTTSKMAFNLPPDSKLVKLSDDVDINFDSFYSANIEIVAATMQTPPAVATSKYDTSYSSSRAALKDWEHTMKIKRNNLAFYVYHPFFELWMQMQVLTRKITVPGMLVAIVEKNQGFMDAFLNTRFIGPNIPHIDPLKEVKAQRLILGDQADHIPLGSISQSTESLNQGDYFQNVEKFKDELKEGEELLEDDEELIDEPNE